MLTAQEVAAKNSLPVPASPAELKKLILKLRWIGHEDEAISLHARLARLAHGEGADLWPRDTD